ncbi:MAG: hypothetical protein H6Q15_1276 [Bacteroidetes bacterium]|nr:hypothetical protein [Bacteroidota bacterium]
MIYQIANLNDKIDREYKSRSTGASSIYNGHSMDNVLKNFGVKNPEEYNK